MLSNADLHIYIHVYISSHDILGVSVKNKTHDKLVLAKQC